MVRIREIIVDENKYSKKAKTYRIGSMGCDWRRVENYEGYYVSNTGQIFSTKSNKKLSLIRDKNGYLCINVYESGKKRLYVHRLVQEAFYGDVLGKNIHHIDNCRSNNSHANLSTLTQEEHAKLHKENGDYKNNGKYFMKFSKPVASYNSIGELCRIYPSVRAATHDLSSKESSKSKFAITSALANHGGVVSKSAYGYHWMMVSKEAYRITGNEVIVDKDKVPRRIEVKACIRYGRKIIIGKRKDSRGETKEFLFESVTNAAKYCGLSRSTVTDNLNQRTKCSKSKTDGTVWIFDYLSE